MNSKGQIAIFVALVFQVLFVFFAMVINVGLLVHQKINLQNSVDLAAYYGAMKQAEELNAVAHMNYQIRQSWKLMVWRFQQLGMAGFDHDENNLSISHPYDFQHGNLRDEDDSQRVGYFPSNCQAYYPYDIYQASPLEDYCLKVPEPGPGQGVPIPAVTIASNNPFLGFSTAFATATRNLAIQAQLGCAQVGAVNWYTLARFLIGHKQDLLSRKQMLMLVANGMSKNTNDFLDLDGESVKDGVVKTLKKNLSPENRDPAAFKDIDIQFFNSLGDSKCGFVDDKSPPKWLADVVIYPLFHFMETLCGTPGSPPTSTNFLLKPIVGVLHPPRPNNYGNFPQQVLDQIALAIDNPDPSTPQGRLDNLSLGFEKNPWCMAYVGVTAKATPSIPFTPFNRITLTAKAFAKPFGGRIGPWYGKSWPATAMRSDDGAGSKKVDTRVPERLGPNQSTPTPPANPLVAYDDVNMNPNYSRFPGDQVGLMSKRATGQWSKSIHDRGPFSFNLWNQILDDPLSSPGAGDVLAWDANSTTPPPVRDLEIAAVAPDIFDMTYYSVEPDFYRNYAARLEKRTDKGQVIIRGDLGARKQSTKALAEFGVKDQIAVAKDSAKFSDLRTKLQYYILEAGNLLTSWQGKNQEDYTIDDARFGKCNSSPDLGPIRDGDPPEKATVGNCRSGGRTGYSVKLVDDQYLKRGDLEIGGQGASGSILNQPPSGF